MKKLMIKLGLSTENSFSLFKRGVRGNADVNVLRCSDTGAYVLNTTDHIDDNYYSKKRPPCTAPSSDMWDMPRRKALIQPFFGKRWLDIGAGNCLLQEKTKGKFAQAIAVDPQLPDEDKSGYVTTKQLPNSGEFDVITLFHSLEHMRDPLGMLTNCRHLARTGTTIIVEVPHARDTLIEEGVDAFIDFTFWEQHLILHTENTLKAFADASGLTNNTVAYIQRYPQENHDLWKAQGKPGGHLGRATSNSEYSRNLCAMKVSDTLLLRCYT